MTLVAYLLVGLFGLAGLVWVSGAVVRRMRARRRRRFLATATAGELARACADSVRFMGWAERATGAPLVDSSRGWTERELLDALEALFADVTRDGKRGYGSDEFFFYDGGFADIAEALRDRLQIPQPWARRR